MLKAYLSVVLETTAFGGFIISMRYPKLVSLFCFLRVKHFLSNYLAASIKNMVYGIIKMM